MLRQSQYDAVIRELHDLLIRRRDSRKPNEKKNRHRNFFPPINFPFTPLSQFGVVTPFRSRWVTTHREKVGKPDRTWKNAGFPIWGRDPTSMFFFGIGGEHPDLGL